MLFVRLELWRANRVFHVTLGVVRLALADVWRKALVLAVSAALVGKSQKI